MSPTHTPLGLDVLEERLEELLDAALSSRRTALGPAEKLALRHADEQAVVLHWVAVMVKTNSELAFQFANHAPTALNHMDIANLGHWASAALDGYDRDGLPGAVAVLKWADGFAQNLAIAPGAVSLEEICGLLEKYLIGLGGRSLSLESAVTAYTDTETLYLPPVLSHFSDKQENNRLYRGMVALLWAQTRFGTFTPDLLERLATFANPQRAAVVYHALENIRLDALLTRMLPGLGRAILSWSAPLPVLWQAAAVALQSAPDGREASWPWVAGLLLESPSPALHHGDFQLQRAVGVMKKRLEREKRLFRQAVGERPRDLAETLSLDTTPADSNPVVESQPDGFTFDIFLDGRPMELPEALNPLLTSIVQDLGEIPPEYLQAAGPGGYRPDDTAPQPPEGAWSGTYHEEGAILYKEWDYHRNDYRKNWCVLRELTVAPAQKPFARDTLAKYSGLVRNIRRSFEMLRGGDALLKKQERGDEVDLDALVDALAEAKSGMEMSDRLFQRVDRSGRDVAAVFMVDMSGSTKGWINDAIRESLILLCEGLNTLGDRYAIYGFSGNTRKRCELYRIKAFDEPYGEIVKQRIAGIQPLEYTRMGVFIRHLTGLLNGVTARIRLLITLSDGKPEDYDGFRGGYRGRYGMEDTRKALIEARQAGVHPFCITIDKEAQDYLPQLYGPAAFTVLYSVRALPTRISDIYRKLTT